MFTIPEGCQFDGCDTVDINGLVVAKPEGISLRKLNGENQVRTVTSIKEGISFNFYYKCTLGANSYMSSKQIQFTLLPDCSSFIMKPFIPSAVPFSNMLGATHTVSSWTDYFVPP